MVFSPHFKPQKSDFHLANYGSIFILTPLTLKGQAWIDEHISKDAQKWGVNGIAIEHRYVEDIYNGAKADGLLFA